MTLPFGPIQPIPEPTISGSLLGDWAISVTRLRAGSAGEDRRGEPIPGADVSAELPPAIFQPEGNEALVAAGVSATGTEPTVYWPNANPDVRVGDRLVIDGDTWLVHERPSRTPLGLVVIVQGVESTRGSP
ncbi:hypothetical protein [Pseudoclavibacter sp. AY1H1]|uniref:hypothetical protein n=1 Tax=Pseudoclavibacter sp. AY1H1 TaxID=2080584 RepID=UPI0011B02B6B|nr:hypothetical protein [Pseudoclavibacter sp. AY1H1]